MKVFISHSIENENLAKNLKGILEKSDQIDEAIIAQKIKKYDIEISEKITEQIVSSDCVVVIITKNIQSSASVHQELGYAQGKEIPKIPMIEKDAEKGILAHGKDVEEFTSENFIDICNVVKEQIIQMSTRNKHYTAEEIFIQKSAHFRYEIKQYLDDMLNSIICRFEIIPKKQEGEFKNIEDEIYFKEIVEAVNHNFSNFDGEQISPIEEQLLKLPLAVFQKFNNDFEKFRSDINEIKKLPHNDLLSDELDAFQKLDKTISDIRKNDFYIEDCIREIYTEEDAVYNRGTFLQTINEFPEDVSEPLKNMFRTKIRYLVNLTKSIILLEQKIYKIYEKYGKISLKDRHVD